MIIDYIYFVIQVASTETLQYYGAKLLETSPPLERVTLESRHVLQDFTYSPDYLQSFVTRERPEGGGGAALEHHDFAHLDCPFTAMEDSGHYIIAKFLNQEKTKIAITGFQVNYELLILYSEKCCKGSKVPHSLHSASCAAHQQLPERDLEDDAL